MGELKIPGTHPDYGQNPGGSMILICKLYHQWFEMIWHIGKPFIKKTWFKTQIIQFYCWIKKKKLKKNGSCLKT